ncbi:hypothetical protein EG68_06232 [Paragonimus skrjabini miyazakii]|uniref:Cadherin domain-containing protein n=1 Tax=Paragonimus skrjabini miyazakii TaxID=59628 RepID=A0A8S9YV73_9TREM|nr:hypothetical protein EG68_06232 [Paragonimus skrjabini miyazakii]
MNSGSIVHTYEIQEETSVPIHIGDLFHDLCGFSSDSVSNVTNMTEKFIIFPSSQPYYSYFEIRQIKIRASPEQSQMFVSKQFLMLSKPLDREKLCDSEQHLLDLNRKIHYESPIQSDIYVHESTSGPRLCLCQPSLGWCAIHLHLTLVRMKIQPDSNIESALENMFYEMSRFFILQIRVIDINDNHPVFQPSNYELIISESEVVGTEFRLPSAIDADLGSNSQLSFDIAIMNLTVTGTLPTNTVQSARENNSIYLAANSTFSVHSNMISFELFLRLEKQLDREFINTYLLSITAVDHGVIKARTGQLMLTVKVADVNDESPQFTKTHYVFTLSEKSPPGFVIGFVSARDPDSGDNGRIRYGLVDHVGKNLAFTETVNRIRINPDTGAIQVHGPLDREKQPTISLRIEASDYGQPARTSVVRLSIQLTDVNDNSPVISIFGLKILTNEDGLVTNNTDGYLVSLTEPGVDKQATFWLTELIKPSSVVAVVDVSDMDEALNAEISCFVHHTDFLLQTIRIFPEPRGVDTGQLNQLKVHPGFPSEGKHGSSVLFHLVVLNALDRETISSVQLSVVCHDAGKPISRSSTVLVQIYLMDENDCEPQFDHPEIYTPANWLNVVDFFGSFDKNTFKTTGNRQSELLVNKYLKISIPETINFNHSFAHFPAFDDDDGLNGVLHYQLKSLGQTGIKTDYKFVEYEWNSEEIFMEIDTKSGHLFITKDLKRYSVHRWYNFAVVLQDMGEPVLTNTLLLAIQILIVNANPPSFVLKAIEPKPKTVPNRNTNLKRLEIFENAPPGTPFGRLFVQDSDRDEAGRVTYWLENCRIKKCNGSFQLDRTIVLLNNETGVLTTTRPIDRRLDGDYLQLNIVAQDHGNPVKAAQLSIDVYIIGYQDSLPQFMFPPRPCFLPISMRTIHRMSCDNHTFPMQSNLTLTHSLSIPEVKGYAKRKNLNGTIMQPVIAFEVFYADAHHSSVVTYKIESDCTGDQNDLQLHNTFAIEEFTGCLQLLRIIERHEQGTVYIYRIVANVTDRGTQKLVFLDVTVRVELGSNDELQLQMNLTQSMLHCNEQQTLRTVAIPDLRTATLHELTPSIRVLMSITTVIGATMVVMIIVLFVKRPSWFFGRKTPNNSTQSTKVELFQCREVHNLITEPGMRYKANYQDKPCRFLQLTASETSKRSPFILHPKDAFETELKPVSSEADFPIFLVHEHWSSKRSQSAVFMKIPTSKTDATPGNSQDSDPNQISSPSSHQTLYP